MTSYDERHPSNNTHGIHMHDPRVIEYMGAPESARLMGRTPEYWVQHMGRRKDYTGGASVAPRRESNYDEYPDPVTAGDKFFSSGIGGDANDTREGTVPYRSC